MRVFLKWFFNPGCSCEVLRERVSLAERSEALCRDAFAREWSDRRAWEQTAESNGKHAVRLEAEVAALREDFARRYRAVCVLYRLANESRREAECLARSLEMSLETALARIDDLKAQLNAGGPVS
jgi:hypothetical protein